MLLKKCRATEFFQLPGKFRYCKLYCVLQFQGLFDLSLLQTPKFSSSEALYSTPSFEELFLDEE